MREKSALQAQLTAANAKLEKMRESVFNWCKDCELQGDCIAPNMKPCTLKPAYKIALTQAEALIKKGE